MRTLLAGQEDRLDSEKTVVLHVPVAVEVVVEGLDVVELLSVVAAFVGAVVASGDVVVGPVVGTLGVAGVEAEVVEGGVVKRGGRGGRGGGKQE